MHDALKANGHMCKEKLSDGHVRSEKLRGKDALDISFCIHKYLTPTDR